MKKLLLVLLSSLSVSFVMAQELSFSSGRDKHDHKPQLFAALSPKIAVSAQFIDDVMQARVNQAFRIVLADGFVFNGNVTARTSDAPGLESVMLHSSEVPELVFSVSRLTLPDQSVVYRGIITSKRHSDMLLMEKDAITGNYYWNRKNVSRMISD
mgnify:CR=1 FL=1